jgi:hypothetical protein
MGRLGEVVSSFRFSGRWGKDARCITSLYRDTEALK